MFGSFTTGKESNDAERRWNLMWDMWVQGTTESPYTELMEYESEVNNGGHSQYFFNTANIGDLKAEVEVLYAVLPEALRENLKKGYEAFAALEDICDDVNEDLLEECDDFFYKNENLLLDILKGYADNLSL